LVFSLYLTCGVDSGAGSSLYPTKKFGFPQVWQKLMSNKSHNSRWLP
jgi:hypothetical protein